MGMVRIHCEWLGSSSPGAQKESFQQHTAIGEENEGINGDVGFVVAFQDFS